MRETDMLAFVDYVLGQSQTLACRALARQQKELGTDLLSMCSEAARVKRQLLGQPEPDPDVDYDPDYHWDGTPILPGETRREKPGTA